MFDLKRSIEHYRKISPGPPGMKPAAKQELPDAELQKIQNIRMQNCRRSRTSGKKRKRT